MTGLFLDRPHWLWKSPVGEGGRLLPTRVEERIDEVMKGL